MKTNLSLTTRRALIVTLYADYLLLMLFLSDFISHFWLRQIGLFISAGWLIVSFILLFISSSLWKLGNAPDEQVDERQVTIRNQAYRYAYMLVSTFIVVVLIYMSVATDKGYWVPNSYTEYNAIFWGVFLLTITLPSSILGWTEEEV